MERILLGAHFELKAPLVLLPELSECRWVKQRLLLVSLHHTLSILCAWHVLKNHVVGDVE